MGILRPTVAALALIFTNIVAGSYPTAHSIQWKSTNFKTFLTWEPKPTSDYTYTVEFSENHKDKQKILNCVRTSSTVCDLTASLTNLNASYVADVLSEPPIGMHLEESQKTFNRSLKFCPYSDTDILRPEFKLETNENSTVLYVTDSLTALFQDDRQLSIRDIFGDHLSYKVTFRKNMSSGKKIKISKGNVIEFTDLDQGESYCFTVQAFIPSRRTKQLGEMSTVQCSQNEEPSIFEVYSVTVIAVAILIILLLTGIIITIAVVCCRRRKKNALGTI